MPGGDVRLDPAQISQHSVDPDEDDVLHQRSAFVPRRVAMSLLRSRRQTVGGVTGHLTAVYIDIPLTYPRTAR